MEGEDVLVHGSGKANPLVGHVELRVVNANEDVAKDPHSVGGVQSLETESAESVAIVVWHLQREKRREWERERERERETVTSNTYTSKIPYSWKLSEILWY